MAINDGERRARGQLHFGCEAVEPGQFQNGNDDRLHATRRIQDGVGRRKPAFATAAATLITAHGEGVGLKSSLKIGTVRHIDGLRERWGAAEDVAIRSDYAKGLVGLVLLAQTPQERIAHSGIATTHRRKLCQRHQELARRFHDVLLFIGSETSQHHRVPLHLIGPMSALFHAGVEREAERRDDREQDQQ